MVTGVPDFADAYSAWTIRTSCSPSLPDGSGSRCFKMQSEKYSSSGANQIARRIDAVHADAVQRPAAVCPLRTNVSPPDSHRERRIEELQLAQPSTARQVDGR